MKVRISIPREIAIRAGSELYGSQVVDVSLSDLTADERAVLADSTEYKGAIDLTIGIHQPALFSAPQIPLADGPLPAVRAWIKAVQEFRALMAQKAKEQKAEEEARRARAAEETDRKCSEYQAYWAEHLAGPVGAVKRWHETDGIRLPIGDRAAPDLPSYATAVTAALYAALEPLVVDYYERERAEVERRKAERKAAEQRRADQLAAWVDEHMDANAQGRFALGMLPEPEILDSMRAAAFASLDGMERYARIYVDDIEHAEECCGEPNLSCETTDARDLTADEYERLSQIRDRAPEGAVITCRRHACTCDYCGETLRRLGIHVALTVGEIDFSREYAG